MTGFKIKNIGKILIVIAFFSLLIPNDVLAAKIGQACKDTGTNDDCEQGSDLDCEKSTIPNKTICTCWSDEDCTNQYGGSPDGGNWKCVIDSGLLSDLSYDLHYCKSTNMVTGDGEFPITPLSIPQYYCLGYDQNSKQLSCVAVPVKEKCYEYPNLFYQPKNFKTLTYNPSTKKECLIEKNKASTEKFCLLDNKCLTEPNCDILKTKYNSLTDCLNAYTPSSCTNDSDCGILEYCLKDKCYNVRSLAITNKSCNANYECQIGFDTGACVSQGTNNGKFCAFTNTVTTLAESMPCGDTTCIKSDKPCVSDTDCTNLIKIGKSMCQFKSCWFDAVAMSKYKALPTLFGQTIPLEIRKPELEIHIPQLQFSDVSSTLDSEGNISIPYIGEYISAVYKFGMVVASIIAVIMIIVEGIKITVMGGEQTVTGMKRIGQIVIGLFITWGSYAILYNINPDLVNFKALKVQYIKQEELPDDIDTSDEEAALAGGDAVGEKGACDKINPTSPSPDWVDLTAACAKNKCPGLSVVAKSDPRENFVAKITADKLMIAGKKAAAQGYVISVRSKCRSIASQQALATKQPGGVASGTVAKPGNSPHGTGLAVDLVLLKNGTAFSDGGFSGKNQCNANPAGVAALSSIMYSAGFIRYGAENWHFEAQKAGNYCRTANFTGVSPCIPPAKGAERCPAK